MLLLSFLVCLSTLLQVSLSTPVMNSKPKPVNLYYSCIIVTREEQQDIKSDEVPVVLLHGMTQTTKSWDGVSEALAFETKKKICAVDLRNHGQSPWNDDEYDVVAMTEDIKHFIDEDLRAPKAIVIGHSLGGKVALHLALNYPESVEKVIVEDMKPNGGNPDTLKQDQFYFKLLVEMEKDISQGVSEKKAKEEFFKLLKERFEKENVTFALNDPSLLPIKCSDGACQYVTNPVLFKAFANNRSEVMNESSGRFDGPALFIYGTKSGLKVGDDEENIKKLFPNAKLVGVEGAGHLVHTNKQFTREVVHFINNN